MEEASVAGESPDRSKQRESSAEPTSGSASPVPEARNGATTPDPRLAVARESGGGREADTATRVLSVKELSEETEGAAGEAASEQPAGREEPEAPEDGAESDTTGDDRLRAAVAAWVTSADGKAEEGDADADEPGDGAGAADEAEGEREGDTDADEPGDRAEVANEAEDVTAAGAGDSGGEDGAAEDKSAAGQENSAEAETPAVEEAPAQDETPAVEGALAQRSEPTEELDAHGEETANTGAAAGEPGDTRAAAGEANGKAGATAETADSDTSAVANTANGKAGAATETADSDTGAATETADSDTSAVTETAKGDTGAAAENTKGDTDAAPEDAKDAPKDGSPDAAPDRTKADSQHAATSGRTPQSSADDATKADAPPVDQPTAVFRAVKPSEPAVDQPTTMLKLGDVKKPAPAPESDAERTSKFVALKPLDDPSTRKPPRPAEATTALPKVAAEKSKAPAEATTALPRVPADQTASVPQVGPERTTQQPLPPKPPLDLLAELTNTPPPPETPLRTAVRRVKIWTPLVLLLAIVFAIVQAVRPLPTPALELTAEASYTFDGDQVTLPWPNEGQGAMDVTGIGTMGGFGEQKPVAIGSVAKAMTAYVVLQKHPLKPGEEGPKITVDALAEKEGGYDQAGESTLNTVKEGDQLTLRQALSAIMIPSANNIARLLARWDSGTEAAFIKKMNDTAKELGMKNTTYTDASGLKETTVSTAEDQVKLGNELVQIPALVEITKLPSWFDPSGQKWRNWNTLVPYNGAIGIKTGTTTAAGGNLLFAATKEVGGETVTVVGAILGQHKAPIIDTVNAVSKTAMLGAQDALASAKILKKGDVVGYVDDQLGGRTPVVVTQDVTAVGWAGLKVKLSFAPDAVPHTAKAGTKVGTLTVGDGSGGAVEVPVALQSDLTEPGFTDKLTRVA
ncbi:D-alanyl-D-alanine carboxypeptidase [Streptomyces spinoverrucosus]|uniref:serine-type D-Ala-D-Ala carboxypeptidase n=1 Tax=Streptomyces spinoverrucosus TaxID=284043 RepID=A0A4Y3VLN3_9ACTN|nr:D-alanyl-D-alanine carboxypeptidase [Streptomyces spinoverrucosus]GEC06539.1 D-alanyl-D-alanine carboxypeptidase [Streptomyces spinoverrucosus]GHB54481.1 D-alanyl-D-alanine carboxypeptidase [Streptomyces spinoverrucosus]